jgi:hypothetical protein
MQSARLGIFWVYEMICMWQEYHNTHRADESSSSVRVYKPGHRGIFKHLRAK